MWSIAHYTVPRRRFFVRHGVINRLPHFPFVRLRWCTDRPAEQRRQHALHGAEQRVRFAVSRREFADLFVLRDELALEQTDHVIFLFDAFFELLDIARHLTFRLSSPVATCRHRSHVLALSQCGSLLRDDWCRDLPRLVAACRDIVERAQFSNLCDVSCDRLRRHQVLVAECRRYFLCIEMAADAVSLQRSDGARVSGLGVALRHLFDRQGVIDVAACRGWPRRVGACRNRCAVSQCPARGSALPLSPWSPTRSAKGFEGLRKLGSLYHVFRCRRS